MTGKTLKIKITAALFFAAIAGCFIFLETTGQARIESDQNIKSPVVIVEAKTKCNVKAYRSGLAGSKPKTLIVRDTPGKNGKVVKTVTTKEEIVYYITASNDAGWFEISKIETTGGDSDEVVFEGSGWIPASLTATSVANSDAKLYALPKKNGRVLKKLIADESEARPIACDGDWMKIQSGKSTGWLSADGQCPNPLTTCS